MRYVVSFFFTLTLIIVMLFIAYYVMVVALFLLLFAIFICRKVVKSVAWRSRVRRGPVITILPKRTLHTKPAEAKTPPYIDYEDLDVYIPGIEQSKSAEVKTQPSQSQPFGFLAPKPILNNHNLR